MKIDEVKKSFDLKKKSGIYLILCIPTLKGYIGSSINLFARLNEHLLNLRHNKHQNNYLQNAWNKYEKADFEIFIIEQCNKIKLFELEQFYVNLYKTSYKENGYNLACIQKGNYGYSFTEEQKKKVSDGVKKKLEDVEYKKARQAKIAEYTRSEEGRKKRSEISKKNWENPKIRENIITGIHDSGVFETRKITHNTPEVKAKLSKASKEQWSDPEHRQKMSGIKKEQYANNPELREKVSKATTEAMNTPEMKNKISIAMKKFNVENPERVKEIKEAQKKTLQSEEHRQKASQIGKELWATEEHRNKMIEARKDMYNEEFRKNQSEVQKKLYSDPIKLKEIMLKRTNITPEQFEQLKELHRLGYTQAQIAKVLGCKREAVGRICRGESKLYVIT